MAGEELKYPISVPVETNAREAGASVEALREQILGGEGAIKEMSGALRRLRGNTDEVKSAKSALKTRIDATKNAVSAASLGLVKQGTTYDGVAMRAKKFADQQKHLAASQAKLGASVSKMGGPVSSLKGKLDSLKEVLGGAGGAAGLATLAIAGTIAVVVAMAAAVAHAGVQLGKFILGSANAARSANLAREAWAGTAKNAANLGTQVDALANKVPTSKNALNELAISLAKTRLGGQTTVDTFNAVAQASSALGDEAGGKLKDFVERGRLMGRMQINPREMLEGFGNLEFDDIAKALAESTHVGVEEARAQLRDGRAKLADGAAAMRKAVESKFGDLNLRKMLDLDVMSVKLHEKLAGLTKNVNLEPLLKPLGEMAKLLDGSTATGAAMQKIVTVLGTGMVTALTKSLPVMQSFFEGAIIGALDAYIAFLDLKNAFKKTFGDKDLFQGVDVLGIALNAGKIAATALAIQLGIVVASLGLLVVQAKAAHDAVKALLSLNKKAEGVGVKPGAMVVDGLLAGLVPGGNLALAAGKALAEKVKGGFTTALDIHSPSRVFAKYGEHTAEGYAQGVDKGAPRAVQATNGLAVVPSSGGAQSQRGGGGSPVTVHVNITASGGESSAKSMSDPSFLAQLTKAIEDALSGAGLPVQA